MSTNGGKVRVLCVDDEPQVLGGLKLHLRRYEVLTAESSGAALDILGAHPGVAVVMSDMRMPGMDGAALLRVVRERHPETVRMLLTGHADVEAAAAAINEGQIFRFLVKPCAPPLIVASIDAAVAQHRLLTAERVLLEQTLRGSIQALMDVLALTSPAAFGRASRVKALVAGLAGRTGARDFWQADVAAMVCELGSITLPGETVENLHHGRPLGESEEKMVRRVPLVTEQLLAHIPRLEIVRGIIAECAGRAAPERPESERELIRRGASLLRVALDYDALETQGHAAREALATLRSRARYDPAVLAALEELRGSVTPASEIRELPVSSLRVGMRLAQDLQLASGTLLVARGYVITPGLIERLRNLRPGTVNEPIRVALG